MLLRVFLVGIGVGIALTLWGIARSMSTAEDKNYRWPEGDDPYEIPFDPYIHTTTNGTYSDNVDWKVLYSR